MNEADGGFKRPNDEGGGSGDNAARERKRTYGTARAKKSF